MAELRIIWFSSFVFNMTEQQNVRQLIRAEKSLSSEGTSSCSGLEVELLFLTGPDRMDL